jgi:hypothetical protein
LFNNAGGVKVYFAKYSDAAGRRADAGACLSAKDGALNTLIKNALGRYQSIAGEMTETVSATGALVVELSEHTTRVCPIERETGKTRKGETCIADERPSAAPTASSAKVTRTVSQSARHVDQKPLPEAPPARLQALARPGIVAAGGRSLTMIGVGF